MGNKPELFIATKKDWKQRKAILEQEPPRGHIPDGLTERERMGTEIINEAGKKIVQQTRVDERGSLEF